VNNDDSDEIEKLALFDLITAT